MNYRDFFNTATGNAPYPYQERLATEDWPEVLRVPTGAGKTAAVILSWLFRREHLKAGATRLVFCLPMRVLVRQTVDNANDWLKKLGLAKDYKVYELMGGFVEEDWESRPGEPCILVGTQDMLLSRALNRGYAMSRYRWSVPFGLLHSDCQWIFDEVQLMGVARATSVQLQAFRDLDGTYGPGKSLWMSATVLPDWLASVDRRAPRSLHDLSDEDLAYPSLARRMGASKLLSRSPIELTKENKKDYGRLLAEFCVREHYAGTLTLLIVNQVERAIDVYRALQKLMKSQSDKPETLLLHSRYRPLERGAKESELGRLQMQMPSAGAIIVSTQVVEAGLDLSAHLLITEICPFSSFVQRLGRCNRDGLQEKGGLVRWVDLTDSSLPYDTEQLNKCREVIQSLTDVSPEALRHVTGLDDEAQSDVVIRHKDMLELFETTSDLAGEDVDVSRYIREPNDRDLQVFWREFDGRPAPTVEQPSRDELCSVSVNEFRNFLSKERIAYRWSYGEERWVQVDKNRIIPGQVYLIPSTAGGYDPDLGFGRDHKAAAVPVPQAYTLPPESYNADRWSKYDLTLLEHTVNVLNQMRSLLEGMASLELPTVMLLDSCLWHDYGKAHDAFQGTMYGLGPNQAKPELLLGKSKKGGRHYRAGFRHEFASALAALQLGADPLVVFLVAVHHGKVRFSVRPIPQEQLQAESASGELTIRGVKTGDVLPPIQFEWLSIPEPTLLDLSCLELGHERGWVRTLMQLLENSQYGIFRLAFLEALLRCADVRASQAEGMKGEVQLP